MAAAASGMPAQSHLVDRPTSRLSKRITRWPRAASTAQKSSSQRIICAARPILRRSGRPSGAPKVSYAISMPLARAVVMRPSLAELADAGQALAATESERLERTRSEGRRRAAQLPNGTSGRCRDRTGDPRLVRAPGEDRESEE